MSADAVAVAVAKAVTARLGQLETQQKFCERFTPERSYADWDLDLTKADLLELQDVDKLRVDVVPSRTENTVGLSSRSTYQYEVAIDIAVRRKFGADKQDDDTGRVRVEEVDKLMLLVQQIHTQFTKERLSQDFEYPVWDGENGGTRILVAPHQHLRTLRQFTGIIRIVFRTDVKLT